MIFFLGVFIIIIFFWEKEKRGGGVLRKMGCAQSKIENEESVSRCKDRRNFMKEAVSTRNAFASAHSGYAMSLKNTGAALSDYAQGEAPPPSDTIEPVTESLRPPPPPIIQESNLPPPPPPLPSFSPSPVQPLKRALTMPEFSSSKPTRVKMKGIDEDEEEEEETQVSGKNGGLRQRNIPKRNDVEELGPETPIGTPAPPPPPDGKGGMAWDYFFMVDDMPGSRLGEEEEEEEGEDEEEEENDNGTEGINSINGNVDEINFKTPEKVGIDRGLESEEEVTPVVIKEKQFLHSNTAPPGIRGTTVKVMPNGVDLLKVLSEVDDHFLKASQCAQEVSKMLEATRLHYHSNFADSRGKNS